MIAQHGGILERAMPTPDPTPALRLFFALWPDPALRRRLAAHAALWRFAPPARASRAEQLHLTLLFMDGVAPDALDALCAIGAAVAARTPRFALALDAARVWPGGGIAHLAPREPAAPLLALHAALRDAVSAAALPCDRRAFSAHVTLARRASAAAAPSAFAPLPWAATRLSLVQSRLGEGRYQLLASWALGAPPVDR
jgi:2'-5' RNA ligase